MSRDIISLYKLCLNVVAADCVTLCKFCKREFRVLPDNVLFDFYSKLYVDKRLCLLGVEFSDLNVFGRLLRIRHKRHILLKSFQSLLDHGSPVREELVKAYAAYRCKLDQIGSHIVDVGLNLGEFFNEGGWNEQAIQVLNVTEELIRKKGETAFLLEKLLICYIRRLRSEATHCLFKSAQDTLDSVENTVKKLKQAHAVPNLAEANIAVSNLYFIRSEYDEALQWANKAMRCLDERVPVSIRIDVFRHTSKLCVLKRYFPQAKLLIHQAVILSKYLYATNRHPRHSDVLMDYGFYLLNYDMVKESVKVYQEALDIRKAIFEKNNLQIAIGHEDLAYAQYVHEYSSGKFYIARENADKALRILEKMVPDDHLLLASAMRVKALIFEEIALDLRDGRNRTRQEELLFEAERLHQNALKLSLSVYGQLNVQTAKHYGNLGRLYQTMMRYTEAESKHLLAIKIKEDILGSEDYEVGLSVGHLASLYSYHMFRWEDAVQLYKRSLKISLKILGANYSGLEYDYRGLIHCYNKMGNVDEMAHYTDKMRQWNARRTLSKITDSLDSFPTTLHIVLENYWLGQQPTVSSTSEFDL